MKVSISTPSRLLLFSSQTPFIRRDKFWEKYINQLKEEMLQNRGVIFFIFFIIVSQSVVHYPQSRDNNGWTHHRWEWSLTSLNFCFKCSFSRLTHFTRIAQTSCSSVHVSRSSQMTTSLPFVKAVRRQWTGSPTERRSRGKIMLLVALNIFLKDLRGLSIFLSLSLCYS